MIVIKSPGMLYIRGGHNNQKFEIELALWFFPFYMLSHFQKGIILYGGMLGSAAPLTPYFQAKMPSVNRHKTQNYNNSPK